MSEKFRLDRKIGFHKTFYTKCINVIIDSNGPSIILRRTIFPHDPFYEGIFSHVSVSVHCIFPKNAFI